MKILIVGDAQRYNALLLKGGFNGQQIQQVATLERVESLASYQLVIDLIFDDHPEHAALYAKFPEIPVLAGIVKTSLAAVMNNYAFSQGFNLVGCNWLPGFIEMPVTEVSLMDDEQQPLLQDLMRQLGWQFEVVKDSVGMVTPRVVCMIINEAYMAAEEEIASRADINTAMRLGTNYPLGPFEWCEKIGVKHVAEVLSAISAATGNERYKVSPLLAREAQTSNVK
ncbi:3-hydroxybutyryl-CoA dehydrogenase [Chitinophaga sp. CF118]|uniref:3-hydroxyacyl-CoA dehydrogenase family protein n=1 Tax=Chitinophaga sp. CF118 TaxID=1884367 RepID=UPI0008ECA48D|nr:3-hydroxyacyl-CoA dehydrogenase family protein [Chitinophaga sp. CF118]SFE73043.1 3-hydroxybutyryl-CoA dehydrogenase [Chitinophaga sp. CF118]